MHQGHIVAIRPRQITVTALLNREEAQQVSEQAKNTINTVYERRDSIAPVMCKQARLDLLRVYRELPQTNCGECGEATILAFAARVVSRELPAGRCTPLLSEGYKESKERL